MGSNPRELAVFQHIMLENDICTETHSLTLKVLGKLKSCRTPDSRQLHLNTLLSLLPLNNYEEHVRPKGYFENIIPTYSMSDFQSHFRLERTTFESLICVLHQQSSPVDVHPGNAPISIEKQTLITLWYLANEETMRSIADRFDSAKSSIHNSIMHISRILAGLKSDYIHWSFDEYREATLSFQTKSRFPGNISIRHKKIIK